MDFNFYCRNYDEDMNERERQFFALRHHLRGKLRFQCAKCHFFFFLGFVPVNRRFDLKGYIKEHKKRCQTRD